VREGGGGGETRGDERMDRCRIARIDGRVEEDARREKTRRRKQHGATKAEGWFRTGRGKPRGPKIWGTHAVNPRLESYPIV